MRLEFIFRTAKIKECVNNIRKTKAAVEGRKLQLSFGRSRGEFVDAIMEYSAVVNELGDELAALLDRVAEKAQLAAESFEEMDNGIAKRIIGK